MEQMFEEYGIGLLLYMLGIQVLVAWNYAIELIVEAL